MEEFNTITVALSLTNVTKFKVVNIVARGHLGREIDLSALEKDIDAPEVYIKGPGLYFKLDKDSPTVTLARSGKYIITGCSSSEELESERKRTLNYLTSINLLQCPKDKSFEIVNVVATYELEKQLDLNTLVIHLGMEQTEYEPEQFPGVIFRPEELNVVFLLFNSGKVVITGTDSIEVARKSTNFLLDSLSEPYL